MQSIFRPARNADSGLSLKAGHPACSCLPHGHYPNIVGVGESDVRRAHRRRAQQARLPGGRLSLNRELSGNDTHDQCCEQHEG